MEELRRLRKVKGLSQAKLAVMAGLDPSTVSQIETGARRANTRTLERLAAALGSEVADLFPKAQAPLPLEPEATGLAAADPSGKLGAADVLEKIAELWTDQLTSGFYDRRTLIKMRMAGFVLAVNHEAEAREYRKTLPPHFRTQLEAAEEQFADVWAQLWEAQQVLEGADRGYRAPPDELAAKREAKREELRQQLRGRQAQHA